MNSPPNLQGPNEFSNCACALPFVSDSGCLALGVLLLGDLYPPLSLGKPLAQRIHIGVFSAPTPSLSAPQSVPFAVSPTPPLSSPAWLCSPGQPGLLWSLPNHRHVMKQALSPAGSWGAPRPRRGWGQERPPSLRRCWRDRRRGRFLSMAATRVHS